MAKGKKTGGRKPGSLNKEHQTAAEKARELGVDPFKILLMIANNDWKGLGYETDQVVVAISEDNGPIFKERIAVETRERAAQAASRYVHPALQAVAVKDEREESLIAKAKQVQELSREDQIKMLEQKLQELKAEEPKKVENG